MRREDGERFSRQMRAQMIHACKRELVDIEYTIRLKTEDIARLNVRKAELERQLQLYEKGEMRN